MNDLLFYLLILALLYYFCYYLPQQKKNISLHPAPTYASKETQTAELNSEKVINREPAPTLTQLGPELEPLLDHLIKEIQTLNQSLTNPQLPQLYQDLTIATKKLAGELP
jgi:hypothetical protein